MADLEKSHTGPADKVHGARHPRRHGQDLAGRARMLLTWNMEAGIDQALRQLDKRIAAKEAVIEDEVCK